MDTVSAERVHIAFFGMRNAGKSSLVNAVTGQTVSVVSEVKGTTTDAVKKAMELLPLGPVVIIDTPGLDDEGALGEKRIESARRVLIKTDIAVLVIDGELGPSPLDGELISTFEEKKIPYLKVYNKSDIKKHPSEDSSISVSAVTGEGIEELKNRLAELSRGVKKDRPIVKDLISEGDVVLLVTPIDEAAPKGRLILPEQLTLREVLDVHASVVLCQDSELPKTLAALKAPPRLVITDSQVFGRVNSMLPSDIPLTSFSILMARYKGDLRELVRGAMALDSLSDGDRVLISEGCTHHRQCNDIGTVKLPRMIEKYSGAHPAFSFTSGGDFPESLSEYKLVVHCGGCMLNEAEMKRRIERTSGDGVPIVNYGVALAKMNGILERTLAPLGGAEKILSEI